MRRTDREITDKDEIDLILQQAQVCRIGLVDRGRPYVVPVNFAARGGTLYFHCATAGRKIDIMEKNPSVCFEADIPCGVIRGATACAWSMAYKSVIGFGEAFFIRENDEKTAVLELLMRKYALSDGFSYKAGELDKVVIIGIRIEEMTGKKNP